LNPRKAQARSTSQAPDTGNNRTNQAKEEPMSQTTDTFSDKLQAKVNDADKRLKDLDAKAEAKGEKAKADAKAYLDSLDAKMKAQQAQIQASAAKAKAWAQDKIAVNNQKIAEWKAQRQLKKLSDHADNAERNAAASIEVASAAIDEAEKATAEAIVARIDSDSAQASA
jgi:hypothetical protein